MSLGAFLSVWIAHGRSLWPSIRMTRARSSRACARSSEAACTGIAAIDAAAATAAVVNERMVNERMGPPADAKRECYQTAARQPDRVNDRQKSGLGDGGGPDRGALGWRTVDDQEPRGVSALAVPLRE